MNKVRQDRHPLREMSRSLLTIFFRPKFPWPEGRGRERLEFVRFDAPGPQLGEDAQGSKIALRKPQQKRHARWAPHWQLLNSEQQHDRLEPFGTACSIGIEEGLVFCRQSGYNQFSKNHPRWLNHSRTSRLGMRSYRCIKRRADGI